MLSWFRNCAGSAVYRWHLGTFGDPLYPYSCVSHGREQAKGMWMGRHREDWLKYIAAKLHGGSLL